MKVTNVIPGVEIEVTVDMYDGATHGGVTEHLCDATVGKITVADSDALLAWRYEYGYEDTPLALLVAENEEEIIEAAIEEATR